MRGKLREFVTQDFFDDEILFLAQVKAELKLVLCCTRFALNLVRFYKVFLKLFLHFQKYIILQVCKSLNIFHKILVFIQVLDNVLKAFVLEFGKNLF